MRVLLTGNEGYLGTVMADALLSAGHDVVGLDSGLYAECVLGPLPAAPKTIHRDIRDVGLGTLAGFDAVIHLAALSGDALGDMDPRITFDINHLASARLARLAHEAGVARFLYASSCSVYGASDDEQPVTEDAQPAPVTAYARSKALVEGELHSFADSDFCPVYLRIPTTFGFSPRLRADTGLNHLVARAFLTGTAVVESDGTPWQPLVHVRDVAAAFLACLVAARPAVFDTAFNVGPPAATLRARDLAEIAAATVPGSDVQVIGGAGNDPPSHRVDFSRILERVPAFVPEWTVERGAAELAAAYREFGLTEQVYRSRFIRAPWLSALQGTGRLDTSMRWV